MLHALAWENQMHRLTLALVSLLTMIAPLAAQTPSPYASAMQHEIKSLSPEDVDDLRAGRGMGLAKPAELNGYPGPVHVLELAEALGLSTDQRAASEALWHRMRDSAKLLGERIIAAERALDRALAEARLDAAGIRAATAEIAGLRGELRAEHLLVHLDQRALLTADQTQRYMALRGYAAATPPDHRHK